jgi:hypothetical protein
MAMGKSIYVMGLIGFLMSAVPSSASLVVNGSFETQTTIPGYQPSTAGVWQGDPAHIVTAELGVTPFDGSRMLGFLGSHPNHSIDGINGGVWQLVDLASLRTFIDTGQGTATLSAAFNRADSAANDRLEMRLSAYAGDVSTFPTQYRDFGAGSLQTSSVAHTIDANPNSWEVLTTTLALPTSTEFLAIEFVVWDDAGLPNPQEFIGVYVDGVSLTSNAAAPIPEPASVAVWSVLAMVGIGFGWRKKRRKAKTRNLHLVISAVPVSGYIHFVVTSNCCLS